MIWLGSEVGIVWDYDLVIGSEVVNVKDYRGCLEVWSAYCA